MALSNTARKISRAVMFTVFAVALTTAVPASAKPGQGAKRHSHAHQSHHGYKKHKLTKVKKFRYRSARHNSRYGAQRIARTPNDTNAFFKPAANFGGGSRLVNEARRYIGKGNPTNRATLWCARFMNMVLARAGHSGTGSDMAKSFASYGRRISGPQVGAIAVLSRGKRGGHVGVVSGVDGRGNPIIVSGNHGRRVAEATYPASRVYAYVMPSS